MIMCDHAKKQILYNLVEASEDAYEIDYNLHWPMPRHFQLPSNALLIQYSRPKSLLLFPVDLRSIEERNY